MPLRPWVFETIVVPLCLLTLLLNSNTQIHQHEIALPPENKRISVNRATYADLRRLPGVTASQAQAILDLRRRRGALVDLGELLFIPGIGAKQYARLSEYLEAHAP
jgi:DNA uptake protein ComE-like DNA-binding protein